MTTRTGASFVLLATLASLAGAGCGANDGAPAPVSTATPKMQPSETPTPTPTPMPVVQLGDPLSGGMTTVADATRNAFGQPARNLPLEDRTSFFVGNALFNRNWVTAPSSTEGSDGLGPLFNARSCSACHFRDGRGRPPVEHDEPFVGLLFRLSVPGRAADGGPLPEASYGDQLNHQAILGVPPEGRALVVYEEHPGAYGDGTTYSLLKPNYELVDLAYGPLDPEILVSPRTAPFLIGLGLLEAVDEAVILDAADPDDDDGDGISGRPNVVWNRATRSPAPGRFGWKANQPTIEQQNAGAFLGDIGVTSDLFPGQNCTAVQTECASAPSGGEPEVDAEKIGAVTFYVRHLAVPARRDTDDPLVLRGEQLFHDVGCASCHRATFVTGEVVGAPALSRQRIHPYTDLLLHDMGPDLADDRPDFEADGREWRTPPLWGIGLVRRVNGHDLLLHDGRARGVAEATLWHGGEGEAARERFRTLSAGDRAALIRFLESL